MLARTSARLGLHVCAYNSYQSVIRGGHIWLRMRGSEVERQSHGDHLNILIALNQDTLNKHAHEVDEGGYVLYNADKFSMDGLDVKKDVDVMPLPVKEISEPFGGKPLMQNTVALGAAIRLLQLDIEVVEEVLGEIFSHKGDKVIEANRSLARAGYDHVEGKVSPMPFEWELHPPVPAGDHGQRGARHGRRGGGVQVLLGRTP